ncbi:MAG: hypothetical protein K6E36_12280 [Oscillospiraceae bacterium]|nr:hypothetical protein [Oscillospiraceae bacterium]
MNGLTGQIAAVSEEARMFLLSVLLGLPAGLLLDALRLLRALIPHGAAAVFFEDALYVFSLMLMLQCAALMFLQGSLRLYCALGMLLGLALYLLTAGAVTGRLLRSLRRASAVIRRRIRQKAARFFVRKSENQRGE